MSDPVTNVEIEDVLSSIRRLVSENGRAPAAPKQAPVAAATVISPAAPVAHEAEAEPAEAEVGRLVLTEALRVTDLPDSIEAEEIDVADAASSLDLEADEASANPFESEPDVVVIDEKLPRFLKAGAPSMDDETVREPLVSPVEEAELVEESPVELVKEIETAAETKIEFRHAEIESHAEDQGTTNTAEIDDLDDFNPRPWEDGDQRLAEWHSVRSDVPLDYEPDEAGDSDYAGTHVASLEWEDHLETPVEAALDATATTPEPLAETSEEPEVAQADDVVHATVDRSEQGSPAEEPQEAVLDEEMLRDLVGEIVRQELQGPLGERITRNVRKLVRREINRALAARSLNDL